MYISKNILAILGIFAIFCIFIAVYLGTTAGGDPRVPDVRAEFYIFALTLMGVALFHHHYSLCLACGPCIRRFAETVVRVRFQHGYAY